MNIEELKKCIDEINTDDLSKFKEIISMSKKIIILGNGGSNAVSSHIAQDYTKALGKRAYSFSDSSRLTCYINDYGMENAFAKFIEHFSDKDTLIILISSSGNSKNVINAAKYSIENKLDLILLSGFDKSNSLNSYSEYALLSFWIDSQDYGVVEISHETILHSII